MVTLCLETPSETAEKQQIGSERATFVATPCIGTPSDPRLSLIVERWASLSEGVRNQLVELVNAGALTS